MSLQPGTKLAHYEILAPVGRGGMGEVYRARDMKLGRDVAIKVLPDELAKDEERVARFEREAKLLASLNHPNIASIYGFEENALVLELVEGSTLAERIAQGPISVEEAIAIAQQIATALEAGHELGVIHRDLKPANIKVKEDGTVKVLDYGLAKALEGDAATSADSELSQSPTLTRQGTQVGVILGTAAYMSPEQAKGTRVDKRTDVFSFGCVLFEMLSGQRVFAGEHATEILAAVIKSEPDWKVLPKDAPPWIRELLRRCLVKDVGRRLRDIGDARIVLEEPPLIALEIPKPPSVSRVSMVFFGIGVLLACASIIATFVRSPAGERTDVRRFTVLPPENVSIPRHSGGHIAISRDGRSIAYVARNDGSSSIYLQRPDQLLASPISGTDGATFLAFSPNGESLAFFAHGKLNVASLSSGSVRSLCDAPSGGLSVDWPENGRIIFADNASPDYSLYEIAEVGGEPTPLLPLAREAGEIAHVAPQLLAESGHLLFGTIGEGGRLTINLLHLDTGERNTLVEGASKGRWVQSGHLVFGRESTLMGVAFDPRRPAAFGAEVSLVENVAYGVRGLSHFAVSEGGTLIYLRARQSENTRLVRVSRDGDASAFLEDVAGYEHPRISPDGTRIAYSAVGSDSRSVWVYALRPGTRQRVTFDAFSAKPSWSPDGERLAFSNGGGILLHVPGDASDPQLLIESRSITTATSWTPDGRQIVFRQLNPARGWDIGVVSVDEPSESELLLDSTHNETGGAVSPDGRWLAYMSDESGSMGVYVRSFRGNGQAVAISQAGATEPVWSRDGRELFFRADDAVYSVSVSGESDFEASKPQQLFAGDFLLDTGYLSSNYDVSPDGDYFVMVQGDIEPNLTVVLNWDEELERLVPTDN